MPQQSDVVESPELEDHEVPGYVDAVRAVRATNSDVPLAGYGLPEAAGAVNICALIITQHVAHNSIAVSGSFPLIMDAAGGQAIINLRNLLVKYVAEITAPVVPKEGETHGVHPVWGEWTLEPGVEETDKIRAPAGTIVTEY